MIDGRVKGNSVIRMCKLGPNSIIDDSVKIATDTNNYFHTLPDSSETKNGTEDGLKNMKIPFTKGKKW